MNGVQRFLSKREGKRNHEHKPAASPTPELVAQSADPNSAADFYGLFDANVSSAFPAEVAKVKGLRQQIIKSKRVRLRDAQILWALRSVGVTGGVEGAYDLLLAMSDASEGIVTPFDPGTRLLGAQNRDGVTCYLDATLFSMFSRLDSFEAMLYNSFDDVARNKLGFLLRLWVNLLRCGKLIKTDITKVVQDSLAECGWTDAAKLHQQDASEAFTFITGQLELPLLTLKMDIYHTGREDADDDHKFINERLLEVAIPPDPTGLRTEVTLEECLEDYFNNRIEVRRYMERRSTMTSLRKASAVHVETVEIDPEMSPITPLSASPSAASPIRPGTTRFRTPSIIQQRYIPALTEGNHPSSATADPRDLSGRPRTGSVRKEVMMPAWQFFSLIPWYTDHAPTSDAQVAAHFSSKRPVLGLCLKRYAIGQDGRPIRLGIQIDVPVEIGVPHFIQDESMEETGSLHGNFKLVLQSVVCHRGNSVDSGHYIALVRGAVPPSTADGQATSGNKTWMRFDDLAPQRVTMIDIDQALQEETPYLLFYQIAPIEGDPGSITSGEEIGMTASDINASRSDFSSSSALPHRPPSSGRPSLELPATHNESRGRSPAETRRASVVSFQEQPQTSSNVSSLNAPGHAVTLNSAAKRSNQSISLVQSKASDGLSRTFSKLTGKKSRDTVPNIEQQADIHVSEIADRTPADKHQSLLKPDALQPDHPPKAHRREKSHSRLSRSKIRSDKPDRECTVM